MSKNRIMLVEDELVIAADLEERLVRMGYEVAGSAASAEEALEMADATMPDLVLMDIMLQSEMDGTQVAERIHRTHNIPIIYLTANSDACHVNRAKVAEPFGFLLKPFEERELSIQIELALYKYELDRQRDWLIGELTEALNEVRMLQRLIPICAWCKKVRDDRGFWNQLESYFARTGGFQFTHAICPDCMESKMAEASGLSKRVMLVGARTQVAGRLKKWLKSAGYEVWMEKDVWSAVRQAYMLDLDLIVFQVGTSHFDSLAEVPKIKGFFPALVPMVFMADTETLGDGALPERLAGSVCLSDKVSRDMLLHTVRMVVEEQSDTAES